MILTQIGCVAIGLWVQHRYISSSLYRTTRDQVWADLEVTGQALLTRLDDPNVPDHTTGGTQLGRATELLGSVLLSGCTQVTLVDSDWQIVLQRSGGEQEGAPRLSTGQRIEWADFGEPPAAVSGSERDPQRAQGGSVTGSVNVGTVAMPDGEHIALAYALPDQTGFLLMHASRTRIRTRAEAGLQPLPLVGGMTLVWTGVLLSIVVYMILSRFYEDLDRERRQGEGLSSRRIQTLLRTRDAVIFGLAKLAESRDPETGDHLDRISLYSSTLASILSRHPKYSDLLTPNFVRLIGISSVLHDIGKVGIGDDILRKPGQLTESERVRMQRHSIIGGECLQEIEQRLGSSNFLQMAREIAFAHHERWDASGYPYGLKGDAIPLPARIVAIADVYDALASKRVYKDSFPHDRCVEIIRQGAGTHFDPELVRIWCDHAGRFRDIARQYGDNRARVAPGATEQEQRPDHVETVETAPALATEAR